MKYLPVLLILSTVKCQTSYDHPKSATRPNSNGNFKESESNEARGNLLSFDEYNWPKIKNNNENSIESVPSSSSINTQEERQDQTTEWVNNNQVTQWENNPELPPQDNNQVDLTLSQNDDIPVVAAINKDYENPSGLQWNKNSNPLVPDISSITSNETSIQNIDNSSISRYLNNAQEGIESQALQNKPNQELQLESSSKIPSQQDNHLNSRLSHWNQNDDIPVVAALGSEWHNPPVLTINSNQNEVGQNLFGGWFYNEGGKYFQTIESSSSTPVNGGSLSLNINNNSPNNLGSPWNTNIAPSNGNNNPWNSNPSAVTNNNPVISNSLNVNSNPVNVNNNNQQNINSQPWTSNINPPTVNNNPGFSNPSNVNANDWIPVNNMPNSNNNNVGIGNNPSNSIENTWKANNNNQQTINSNPWNTPPNVNGNSFVPNNNPWNSNGNINQSPPASLPSNQNPWNNQQINSPQSLAPKNRVYKHVYIHSAPDDIINEPLPVKPITPPPPKQKHYKVIFIKAPSAPTTAAPTIPKAPEVDEKTLVYVLTKQHEQPQIVIPPTEAPKAPSKPEVYFIGYKAKEEKNRLNTFDTHNNNNLVNSYGSPVINALDWQ